MDFAINFLFSFWSLLCQMSWPLLFGYLAAGVMPQFISAEFLARHLGGRGIFQIIKASLFGIPLPLCSCAVLPVAESFKKTGVGKGALTSFLISTPQTGVDSIAVTYGMLGPFFAIFRPLAALISGVFGGFFVEIFGGGDKGQTATEPAKCASCAETAKPEKNCCENTASPRFFAKIAKAIGYAFSTLLGETAGALVAGLLAGALLNILVPDNFIMEIGGRGGLVEMLVMIAFGIPLYVCASASVPVAAVLIAKGISPGAAFVFLMTGPASNIVSFALVARLIGARGLIVYLFSLSFCALALGFAVNLFPLDISSAGIAHCVSTDELSVLQHTGGALLLLLMAAAASNRLFHPKSTATPKANI